VSGKMRKYNVFILLRHHGPVYRFINENRRVWHYCICSGRNS